MNKKLKCPCGSLKLRTQIVNTRVISIDEDGNCEIGKRDIKSEAFSLSVTRLWCGVCASKLKYSDGVLINI